MLYAFFCVIPRRLNFICRRFGTLCLFHLHRRPMKMEQTHSSETLAYKIQTPGNYLEESIQHSEQGESLKSRKSFTHTTSLCNITIHILGKSAQYTKHSEEISRRNGSVWLGARMEIQKVPPQHCQMQVLKGHSYRNCTVHRATESSRWEPWF
jgi:hypothetical protein